MSPHPLGTTAPSSDTRHPTYESEVYGFAILWCKDEPHRIGEVGLFVPFEKTLVGRGRPGLASFLRFGQHRPGAPPVLEPLEWALRDPQISRVQLEVVAQAKDVGLDAVVTGTLKTLVNDREVAPGERVRLVKDDLVLFQDAVLFLVVERQRVMPPLKHLKELHPFGKANSVGMVGESPAFWKLEDELTLAASRHGHVLLLGESGSGKEAAAVSIHRRSPRAKKILNALSAATIPSGLFEAEVFGNRANYPSPGMTAGEGLLPVADDGTAFLDEVGGVSQDDQTKLCRAMQSGEYHKLGESRARKLAATIVAATSADPGVFKIDFIHRFRRVILLPSLRVRKEDIVLIVRHRVLEAAEKNPASFAQFLAKGPDGVIYPRVAVELIAALVRHPLAGNARELCNLIEQAWDHSDGPWIALVPEVAAALRLPRPSMTPSPSNTPSSSSTPSSAKAPRSSDAPGPAESGRRPKCTKEEVVAALEKAGSVQGAALLLGVPRRTLRNWMEEYGLQPPEERANRGGRGGRS